MMEESKVEEIEVGIIQFAKRIHPVYKLLKWEWWDGLPSEEQIRTTLREIIKDALERVDCEISTGGLWAKVEEDEEKRVVLMYGFKIEEGYIELNNNPDED